MSTTARLVRTIRLDDDAIQELLKTLDEAVLPADVQKRRAPRHVFRAKGCVLHTQSTNGGPPSTYLATTRDLSDSGLSFLHGAYLHTGNKCVIQMTTIHGMWQNVPGEIVRCDYVASGVHEVGVRFLKPIDASEFCAEALRCRVLIVDDNKAIIKFVELILSRLNAECDSATDGETAIELATSNVYDLILLDMEMPGISGFETVKRLRDKGYTGTVVAATGMDRPDDERACIEAGCNGYLPKPLAKEQLCGLLNSLRKEPLRSSLSNDSSMLPLIDEFVAALPKIVREIESALSDGKTDVLQAASRNLKADAGSFGFEPISAAAARVENALVEGKTLADIKAPIKTLVELCCQARGTVSK